MKLITIVDAILAMKRAEDYMVQIQSIPMREVTSLTVARVHLELAIEDIDVDVEVR